MNIATLGVAIDPTGAESGAATAKAAAKNVQDSLASLAAAATATAKALNKSSDDSAGAFAKLVANARRMVGMVTGAFTAIASGAVSMVKGITNAFAQIGLAIDGINKLMTPVKGVFSLLTGAVAQAAKLEQTATSIRGLLGGNGAGAQNLMGQFQQLGLETPFEFDDLAEAGKILLAMGGNAKNVTDELRRMGDVASVVQAPIKDIAMVYGKMRQDGRIMAIDIGQLSNYGIPILQEFSKILNVPISQVRDKASEGVITFKHLEQAFRNMTSEGGIAYRAMILQSETWNGKLSNLSDAWNKLKVTVGQPIIDGLRPGLDLLIGEVGKLDEIAKNLAPTLRDAAAGVSAAFKVMTEPGGLTLSFRAAMDYLKNAMRRTWETVGILMGQIFDKVLYKFTKGMEMLASWEFWEGVGEALVSGVKKAFEVMKDYAQAAIDSRSREQITADRIREEYTTKHPVILQIEEANKKMAEEFNEMNKMLQKVALGGIANVRSGIWTEDEASAKFETLRNQMIMELAVHQQPMLDRFSAADRKVFEEMNTAIKGVWNEVRQRRLFNSEDDGMTPRVASFGEIYNSQTSDSPSADRLTWWDKFSSAFDWAKGLVDQRAATESAGLAGAGPEATLFPPGSAENPIDLTEGAEKQKQMADDAERWKKAIMTPDEELTASLKAYDEARKAGLLTEEQYAKLRTEEEQKYHDAIESSTQRETARVEKQLTEHQKLIRSWAELRKQVDQVAVGAAQSITGNLSQALTDLAMGTKSAKEAFGEMATAITRDILKMTMQMLVQIAYAKILGWITGTPTASFGSMLSTGLSGGNILAGVRHGGGPAESGQSRNVPSFAFAFAPRFHGGGVASDEVPAILQKGETVLTRDQARGIRQRMAGESEGGGSGQVTIINVVDPGMVADYHAKNPDAILNIISTRLPQMRQMLGSRRA